MLQATKQIHSCEVSKDTVVFLSTFIPGAQRIVQEILHAHGIERIVRMLDGAVLYHSAHFRYIPCFHNTFEVIYQTASQGRKPVDRLLRTLADNPALFSLRPLRSKRLTSFRLVTSQESQLTAVDPHNRAVLEARIARETGLRVNRAKADVEYWLLSRSEGVSFFLRRMGGSRITEKQLQPGELRPELCYLLNWLSRPGRHDVFLDPFCGSGAIPLSRLSIGSPERLYAADLNPAKAAVTQQRLRASFADFPASVWPADIAAIPGRLPAGSISRIVTDPPWGLYEQADIVALYRTMLETFAHVARPGARIVILTAARPVLESTLQRWHDTFCLETAYPILVSGKKATIYVLTKHTHPTPTGGD